MNKFISTVFVSMFLAISSVFAGSTLVAKQQIMDGNKVEIQLVNLGKFSGGYRIYVSYEGIQLGEISGPQSELNPEEIKKAISNKKVVIDYNKFSNFIDNIIVLEE